MRIALFLIAASILFQSCDSATADNRRFIESRSFSFTAAIDPSTLTQQQQIVNIYSSATATRDSTYTISTSSELNAFNATLGAGEQPVTLDNLDTYTYFLVQEPACPESYVYTGNSYNNGVLVITADFFFLEDVACANEVTSWQYDIFRANKL
jgi:hypothetical protein